MELILKLTSTGVGGANPQYRATLASLAYIPSSCKKRSHSSCLLSKNTAANHGGYLLATESFARQAHLVSSLGIFKLELREKKGVLFKKL